MDYKQIAAAVNAAFEMTTGKTGIVAEDLGNIVDAGREFSALDQRDRENYARSLVDAVGKTVFVNRPYTGRYNFLKKDAWRYGSILRKIRADAPDAVENESTQLTAGESYDPNIFTPAALHEKFFNKSTTFEVDISIPFWQLDDAFKSAEEVAALVGMIEGKINDKFNVSMDNLAMRTVNNFIAETIYNDYGSSALSSKSGKRAINLLYLFNETYGLTGDDALTADKAITNPAFIRFASYTMGKYAGYLRNYSQVFNIGGTLKHTPADMLHVILLDDFKSAAMTYLESDTFHNEYVALPKSEGVSYWQGSGEEYAFGAISKINVKTSEGHDVEASGILGVMFDDEAAIICNERRRTLVQPNNKAEFYNYFHKMDARYLNDFDENFVVFFIA